MAANLIVKFLTDTTKMAKDLDSINGKLAGFGKAAGAIGGVLAGAFAGNQVVGFLQDATTAAMEDAKSQEILRKVLENTTRATKQQVDGVEAWIRKTQFATGIADDELRPAFAKLSIAGRSVEQVQKDLAVALDISTARGLDLATVTQAMSKAAQGNTTSLQKLGIQVKDSSGNMLTYDQILQNANKTMGGATAAAAETSAGKMARFQQRFRELKEDIGARLLPVAEKFLGWLGKLMDRFDRLSPSAKNMVLAIAGVTAAVTVLIPVVSALAVAVNAATWPVLLVVAAVALLVGGLVLAYKKSETFRNIVDGVAKWFTDTLVPAIKEGIAWLRTKLAPVFVEVAKVILEKWQQFKGWWDENWPRIRIIVQRELEALRIIVTNILSAIREFWRKYGDDIVMYTRGTWDVVKNVIGGALNLIGGAISFFLAVLSGDWKGAWNAIVETTRETQKNMLGIFQGIWGMIRGVVGGAFQSIKDSVNGGVAFILGMPGRLYGLAEGLAGVFAQAGRWAINGLIGALEYGINSVMGNLPKFPGVPQTRVSFPRLATGGIVSKPTMALIGEAGPEAVIPLSRAGNLGMGGNTYNISVSVAAGAHPADVGAEVVNAIKAYERRNGATWRGAA